MSLQQEGAVDAVGVAAEGEARPLQIPPSSQYALTAERMAFCNLFADRLQYRNKSSKLQERSSKHTHV